MGREMTTKVTVIGERNKPDMIQMQVQVNCTVATAEGEAITRVRLMWVPKSPLMEMVIFPEVVRVQEEVMEILTFHLERQQQVFFQNHQARP